jgi:Glycosyltransferase
MPGMLTSTQRPKRVLVGIYQLDHVGGAELYTLDLLKALHSRGDVEVEFFAINKGRLSEHVENELGIPFMSSDQYDVILATHNATVDAIHDRGLTVQICHGAILDLEHPSLYADYHVGITKEVCDSLSEKGYPNTMVLNGLDVEQKRPLEPVRDDLKVVLSLCQSEEANDLLAEVCNKLGVDFLHFNKHKNPIFDIQEQINKADMVVGIGRSVYDAMACGRPCVVFDNRDYNGNRADGYLHPELFEEFVQTNCSGRYRNLTFDRDDLLREFDKYTADDGDRLRDIAVEKLNVEQTAEELLKVPELINPETRRLKNARVFRHRFKRFRKSFKQKLKGFFNIPRQA